MCGGAKKEKGDETEGQPNGGTGKWRDRNMERRKNDVTGDGRKGKCSRWTNWRCDLASDKSRNWQTENGDSIWTKRQRNKAAGERIDKGTECWMIANGCDELLKNLESRKDRETELEVDKVAGAWWNGTSFHRGKVWWNELEDEYKNLDALADGAMELWRSKDKVIKESSGQTDKGMETYKNEEREERTYDRTKSWKQRDWKRTMRGSDIWMDWSNKRAWLRGS